MDSIGRKTWLARKIDGLIVALMASMALLVFGNVVLRYGFNSGITASEEIARLLFVWLTFLGAIVAMGEKTHLGVDTLVRRLPPFGKRLCLIVSDLLILACCSIVAVGGWRQAVVNINNISPVTGIPNAWLYAGAILASLGIAGYVLHSLWRSLTGNLSDEALIQVAESEERISRTDDRAKGVRQ